MHPLISQMEPNEEQRPAILAREQDVVVTAGAGTGKTRTLVARYLSLLAEGLPLRSIVAITFTRKAAREMRNRVRAVMGNYLRDPDLSLAERRRWEGLYHELDAARIGTIHNMCMEILRAHPAEAAIDPRFTVLDEGQAGILVSQAIDLAMAWAADDPMAMDLFLLFGEWQLGRLLNNLMGQRLQAQLAFEERPDDLWAMWLDQLLPPIKTFLDDVQVQASFADLIDVRADGTLALAEAIGDKLATPLAELLLTWDEIQEALAQEDWAAVSTRLALLRINMKQVGKKGNWAGHDPKAAIKELQTIYDERLAGWVGKGINLELDRILAEATPALQALFNEAQTAYSQLKQDRQALDFDDLEDMALLLLRNRADVSQRWQKEIAAILVDEYQDTNGRQRDLVNLINGQQGNLFIVGDAKQSIYRFRGADVSVFRGERKNIELTGGRAYSLTTSYRAHRELISGLNELLRPVLGEDEDLDRPWREPFAPLNPYRQKARSGVSAPYIEMQLTVGSKSSGALHRSAQALVAYLVDLVEQSEDQVRYGDVAILCRASTSFGPYEDALDEASIPYLTVAGRGFYDRPEIRDLMNALLALNDPSDDLAMVGLLRSPVFGFSDMELYYLNRKWAKSGRAGSFWSFLQDEDDPQINRAIDLITPLYRQSGRTPVARLLKAFLDSTHYRAALLRAGYPRAARNVSKLLADAHASGMVTVHEFLEYVNGIRAGAAREGEARATAGDVVRIMSVHAAKGLEFPIVVLGDINHKSPTGGYLFLDPNFGVLPQLNDEEGRLPGLYRLTKQRVDDQEAAEAERLLYVAATRAEEKLILNGCIRFSRSGHPSFLAGWLKELDSSLGLKELDVPYDDAGARAHNYKLMAGDTPVACTIYEPEYPTVQITAPVQEQAEPAVEWSPQMLDPVATSQDELDEESQRKEQDPPLRVWRVIPAVQRPRAPAWIVGLLVHEALAVWRFPNDEFDRWARSRAREHGLADQQRLDDAVRQTRRMVGRFKAHSLYSEMQLAERRLNELPYSLVDDDGLIQQGIIDALFLKDGSWTVVEYKTDRVRDAAAVAQLLIDKDYLDQLKGYAKAVEQLIGGKPRSILVFLNFTDGIQLKIFEKSQEIRI